MGRAQEAWGPDARRGDDDRVGPLSRSRNKAGGPQSLAPSGLPRHGPACCVLAPRRCAKASTASRRLASWVAARQRSLARRQRPGMRGKAWGGRQGGALPTSRNTATRPGRGVPPGCHWAGRLLCRCFSPCSRHGIVAPPRIHPGPVSNAPRALPGSDPRMRGAATTTGWAPFLGAGTKQVAPNPLRPL